MLDGARRAPAPLVPLALYSGWIKRWRGGLHPWHDALSLVPLALYSGWSALRRGCCLFCKTLVSYPPEVCVGRPRPCQRQEGGLSCGVTRRGFCFFCKTAATYPPQVCVGRPRPCRRQEGGLSCPATGPQARGRLVLCGHAPGVRVLAALRRCLRLQGGRPGRGGFSCSGWGFAASPPQRAGRPQGAGPFSSSWLGRPGCFSWPWGR